MTRRTEIRLLDDIDGAPADETVAFGLDGSFYEIDLTARRAGKLRSDLARFVEAARRTNRGGGLTTRRSRIARSGRSDRAANEAIREWARRKQIRLSDRGRIPHTIVERYEAETRG